MYCLQKGKPSTAWNFINTSAHTIQALGLQHNTPTGVSSEEGNRKRTLFWTVYMTEKALSLCLGRSSVFRDQDITLSRPSFGGSPGPGTLLDELAPAWVNVASIQGRIYDDIYSPGALMQPPHARTSRAQALVAELKTAMRQTHDIYVRDSCLPSLTGLIQGRQPASRQKEIANIED